jgi:F0F1-type ATP synthase assembly protein I
VNTPQTTDDGRKEQPGSISKIVTGGFGPFLTLGLQLAISVVVFFFIGYWLDGKFGTSPWCSIGGAFLGAAGGLIKFLKEAMALGKQADEDLKREIENVHREHSSR